jgi:hypothetical protein
MGVICHSLSNSSEVVWRHDQSIGIAVFPFILELLAVLIGVILILNKYTAVRKQPIFYYLSVVVGWYLALAILVLMPADISMAWWEKCICDNFHATGTTSVDVCPQLKPWNYVDSNILVKTFTTVYWVIFFGTWLVFPICQSWVASAEFTIGGRIKAVLRENAIFYGIAGIAGLIGVLILFFTTAKRQLGSTVGLAMTLANNWGLFLLVCLLGVGIVEVPRAYWRRSNVDLQLRYYEYQIGQLYGEYKKSHDSLQGILKEIRYFDQQLRPTDPDRKYIDEMLKYVPPDYDLVGRGESKSEVNTDSIIELNGRLIQCLHDYNASKTLFHRNVEKAFGIQDIIRMRDRNIKYHVPWTLRKISWWSKTQSIARAVNFVEWVYWRWTVQWLWKVVCIVCCLVTAVLLWNEETMFFSFLKTFNGLPMLSVYYLMLWKIKTLTPLAMQFLCFLTLGYNTWCTYDSLMNIRLFNWYKLLPHQQTDTYSLLFSAAYLCRISVPVALNYLYLTGFDTTSSAFVRVMGTMTVVPFFGGNFNIVFPALILLVALATFFDLWNRIFFIFTCGRWKSFEYDEFSEDEYTSTGRDLLAKERDAEQRGTGVEYFGERVVRHGLAGAGAGLGGATSVDPELVAGSPYSSDSSMVPLDDIIGPTPTRPADRFRSRFANSNNAAAAPASLAAPSTPGRAKTPAVSSEAALRRLWETSASN